MLYRVHLSMSGFKLTTLVVIGTEGFTLMGSRPRRPLDFYSANLLKQHCTFVANAPRYQANQYMYLIINAARKTEK